MDILLHYADQWFFTPYVYPAGWAQEDISRQAISLYIVLIITTYVFYLVFAALNYYFIFDHQLMKHPQFLKNQIRMEIKHAMGSIPILAASLAPVFLLEVRGYSRLYIEFDNTTIGWLREIASVFSFLMFTDCTIYWIHRTLHHRLFYKRFHKPHHKWKIASPFASHAFHPVDDLVQGLPYHVYVFLFPFNKLVWLGLYFVINLWTISIHDGNYMVPEKLVPVVNGTANHAIHHLYFDYNYGQYTTLWDRLGGTHKDPSYLKLMEESQKSSKSR